MALETLKGLKEINKVKITRLSKDDMTKWPNEYTSCQDEFINVDDNSNLVSFMIQDGPIKENGKNGCQLVDMVAVAKHMIEELNKKFPCRENAMTITKLDEALMWQSKRTEDRTNRNVEGRNEK